MQGFTSSPNIGPRGHQRMAVVPFFFDPQIRKACQLQVQIIQAIQASIICMGDGRSPELFTASSVHYCMHWWGFKTGLKWGKSSLLQKVRITCRSKYTMRTNGVHLQYSISLLAVSLSRSTLRIALCESPALLSTDIWHFYWLVPVAFNKKRFAFTCMRACIHAVYLLLFWDHDLLMYHRSILQLITHLLPPREKKKKSKVAWMKVIWTTVLESDRILRGPCRATASHLTQGLQSANHLHCHPHSLSTIARF